MRAVLTSFGTTGDVYPLSLLAFELQRRGHDPLLVVPRHCASLTQHLDLKSAFYGPDVTAIESEILRIQNSGPAMQERYKGLVAQLGRSMPRAFSDLIALCRDADVLICSIDPPLGLTIHETTRIPYVALHLTCPYDDSWYRSEKLAGINGLRKLLGLNPIEDTGSIDPTGISPQLTLFALSPHIFLPQPDWPEHFHVTGFFFPSNEEKWEPGPELQAFMAAGEAPVILTFGSMMHEDPASVNDVLIRAAEQAGCRAVLQMNTLALPEGRKLPASVYPLGFASHSWLFSRANCVVHHGSPGTAAAVFRAGVPAVYVPHAFDQFEVAKCAQAQGCAAPPIPFTELSVERLASAIREVLENRSYRESAEILRHKMSLEDGVQTAAKLVEDFEARMKSRVAHPAAAGVSGVAKLNSRIRPQ